MNPHGDRHNFPSQTLWYFCRMCPLSGLMPQQTAKDSPNSPLPSLYTSTHTHTDFRLAVSNLPSPYQRSLSHASQWGARLIGGSRAEAGFDLCPWVLRGKIWSRGRSRTAAAVHSPSTTWLAERMPSHARTWWNNRSGWECESEGWGGVRARVFVLIDPWSHRLCPLICQAEEKAVEGGMGGGCSGLRCFRMSLFGV